MGCVYVRVALRKLLLFDDARAGLGVRGKGLGIEVGRDLQGEEIGKVRGQVRRAGVLY